MLDIAWYSEKPVLDQWLTEYTKYRYGKENQDVIQAWKEFAQTIYSSPDVYQEGPSESIYCARPSLNVNPVSSGVHANGIMTKADLKRLLRSL